jgi:hypothetical protein
MRVWLTWVFLELIKHFCVVEKCLAVLSGNFLALAKFVECEFLVFAHLLGVSGALKKRHELLCLLKSISLTLSSLSLISREELGFDLGAEVSRLLLCILLEQVVHQVHVQEGCETLQLRGGVHY